MSGPPSGGPGPDVDVPEAADDPASEPERGLGHRLPGAVRPAYRKYRTVEAARKRWTPAFAAVAELIVAMVLLVGFGYWLYLYQVGA